MDQRISIWSMFARSCPVDWNRIVLVELLLSVTATFCVCHDVHDPVDGNVMLLAVPFTTSCPVRDEETPSAKRMRSVFAPPPRPSTFAFCEKPPLAEAFT